MSASVNVHESDAVDAAHILTGMRSGTSTTTSQRVDQASIGGANYAQALSLRASPEPENLAPDNLPLHASFSRYQTSRNQENQRQREENSNVMNTSLNLTFSIFDAFLTHDDLLLYFTTQHLEPTELYLLFRMSKAFHYIVCTHLTSYILSSARRWARLTPIRPTIDREPSRPADIPGVGGNPNFRFPYSRIKPSASHRLMRACGTEPTQPGIYSQYDITTLLPFNNYLHLCSIDPTGRTRATGSSIPPRKQRPKPATLLTSDPGSTDDPSSQKGRFVMQRLRNVPTFRYLRFLLQRAQTFQLIIHHLAQQGHHVPPLETPSVLAKLSLTLDIPTNARRIALLRNTKYWTNHDLYVANLVLLKVDMFFTDPVDGSGETTLARLLLSQRGLETLEAALAGRECKSLLDTMRLYVRTWHRPAVGHRHHDILGVPAGEVGKTGLEGWGLPLRQGGAGNARASADAGEAASSSAAPPPPPPKPAPAPRPPLLRPDELIIAEAVRRALPLHQHYTDMMAYGYLDPTTLDNVVRGPSEADRLMNKGNTTAPSRQTGPVDGEGAGHHGDGAASEAVVTTSRVP